MNVSFKISYRLLNSGFDQAGLTFGGKFALFVLEI